MSSMSHTSFSSSRGDSIDFDSDLTLNDRLKAFKSSNFDPEAYVSSKCQSMHEKELRHLCAYLADLKKASAEEMRISVYANYAAFIRTSREISDLEGQLLSMRNLLSSQGAVVQGLADGVQVNLLDVSSEDSKDDYGGSEKAEPSKSMESRLVEFSDTMEVLLAEKRVDDALAKLEEGKKMKDQRTMTPSALLSLESVISEHRQRLADQLAETICERSTRGSDLRSAILALKKLEDGPRAHCMLLKSHHKKLQSAMQGLRSMTTLSGGAYTATVSQLVFTTIAQAANDSMAAFREEPSFTSELVTWAVNETEEMALLLKRHVIASSAGAGGFRVASECVRICLGHCFVLEGRGLALSSVLVRQFRPCIEQALSANLKRIEQISAALAAADDWSLLHAPLGGRPLRVPSTSYLSGATASQQKLSSSAHKFNSMVQEFIEDMGHLQCLQLDGPTMEGVLQAFTAYVALLINALPSSADSDENTGGPGPKIVKIAETEVQQLALLANALLLGDELLPRAAMRLLPTSNVIGDDNLRRSADKQTRLSEQREWKKRLMRSVDRLRDSFCRQHALELIFTEDGEIRLSPFMYLNLDDQMEEPEWFPSPVFQELFAKVSRLASITTDVLLGRERFSTVLLMRLTETVILWLSDDQSFWEEIETGPKVLGPHGLRQLYLDMEFVILFASQGRYLSRHLHQVIKTIIERAIEIVASTGIDPYSVLPDDEWFADVAQIAIKMLTGKANFGNQERDVNSPTASASARSVSSVVSHGSH